MLLIDTEGNADKTIDDPDIPEFLLVRTKDAREILEVMEKVAAGKITFPDKRPVLTVGIDSATLLWDIGKDVAALSAESRAKRNNRPADIASPVLLDWGLAKRPIKRLYTVMDNSPIKFLVFTGREKDLYEDAGNNNSKKIGVTFDAMKGIEYDVNVTLHFMKDPKSKAWSFETVKTQGKGLRDMFPEGKKLTAFPMEQILAFADKLKPTVREERDEMKVAQDLVDGADKPGTPHTLDGLKQEASGLGIPAEMVGKILKDAGFTGFKPSDWDKMVEALKAAQLPVAE